MLVIFWHGNPFIIHFLVYIELIDRCIEKWFIQSGTLDWSDSNRRFLDGIHHANNTGIHILITHYIYFWFGSVLSFWYGHLISGIPVVISSPYVWLLCFDQYGFLAVSNHTIMGRIWLLVTLVFDHESIVCEQVKCCLYTNTVVLGIQSFTERFVGHSI